MKPIGAFALGGVFATVIVLSGITFLKNRDREGSAPGQPVASADSASPAPTPVASRQAVPGTVFEQSGQPLSPEEMQLENARRAQQQSQLFEKAFANDMPDAAQGARIEAQWFDASQGALVREARSQPLEFDVACKSSMCRMEAAFPSMEESDEWMTRMQLQMGGVIGHTTMVILPGPEGQKKVVLYAYREGREPRRG